MNPCDFQSRLFNASSDKKPLVIRVFFLNSILLLLLFLQEKDKAVYH